MYRRHADANRTHKLMSLCCGMVAEPIRRGMAMIFLDFCGTYCVGSNALCIPPAVHTARNQAFPEPSGESVGKFALGRSRALFEIRNFLARKEDPNCPRLPRNPLDETVSFKREHHLMH